ncbi:MAG: lamin tail domain-containing protein [Verrucomicrobiales bacterium]
MPAYSSSDALLEPKLTAVSEINPAHPSGSAVLYSGPVPINSDTTVTARVLADDGRTWSARDASRLVVGRIPSPSTLAISQLHYRPLPAQGGAELDSEWGRSDFEFIELLNVADGAVQMEGVAFVDGIEFQFPQQLLAPGERTVVVANEAAFRARYGAELADSIKIAGTFTGQLNNGGELIRLERADGGVIAEFRYEDGNGWPSAADGEGYALVLTDPFSGQNPATADNWTRSLDIHGSPGAAFSLTYSQWQQFYFAGAEPPMTGMSGPDQDPDNDGASNALEFAFGTDPLVSHGDTGLVRPELEVADGQGGASHAAIRFRARADASGVTYSAQVSHNLIDWTSGSQADGPVEVGNIEMGDGSRSRRFRDGAVLGENPSRYLRASASVSGVED